MKICVERGIDMFGNEVTLGQKVLFNRSAPGGIGVGIVTNIFEYSKDDGTQMYSWCGWKYGYEHKAIDKIYEYQIRTLGKRDTRKREYEIIGKVDENILNSIYE